MINIKDFDELKNTIIKETKGKNVYYLPNPGNWGDGLIRHGTLKLFNDINLKYTELTHKKTDWIIPFIKGGVVIYGGGGAWCANWHNSYVRKLRKRFKVIVLPSTYEFKESLDNVVFFSRDKYESLKNVPSSRFTHDMAFYIGNEFTTEKRGEGIGYFFREDKESSNLIELPKNNIDISHKGNHLTPVQSFFEELDKYSEIYTDRLHVAIGSSLLGKKVHLYPGNYFKIEAVFKSSIEPNFNNIIFSNNFSGTI
jgi:exopolysaccharide biosynthesis predicted pyruvyltransferase EpsI